MTYNKDAIIIQAQFCKTLMDRLYEDIRTSGDGYYSGMANHTRKQADIKRIRLELLELSARLDPWREKHEV